MRFLSLLSSIVAVVVVTAIYAPLAWSADISDTVLLVAKRALHDRVYGSSVLLSRPIGEERHVGFIVNKPTNLTLGKLFPKHIPSQKVVDPVYLGGPTGPEIIFAMVKGHEARIPQEAIIGISYAVASAAVILAMSKATGEAEHLRDMLVGNILSVQWPEVQRTAIIYAALAIFHVVFRKRFLEITADPHGAAARGVSVRFWDFLFYASFGFVVTRSVAIAGVLLVFCYLIVPSVGGMLFSSRIGPRLAIGWVMGVVVSMLGMYVSVQFDLPTGAAIVCTFGAALVVMAAARAGLVKTRMAP